MSRIKGSIPWNKGLTKELDSRVAQYVRNSGRTRKGRRGWSHGLTKEIDPRVTKISKGKMGHMVTQETRDKISASKKGVNLNLSVDDLAKRSLRIMGDENPMRRLSEESRLRFKLRSSLSHKGQYRPLRLRMMSSLLLKGKKRPKWVADKLRDTYNKPEMKERCRQIFLARWRDPIFAKKITEAQNRKPNKAELLLLALLDEYFSSEWQYVGDGKLIISGKCPDYMNINGKKQLIELYGNWWHRYDNPEDRINYFKQFGYSTLVIWENELKNKPRLLDKITEFNRIN